MRIIVCGGRRYSDRAAVFRILDRLHAKKGIDFLIQGSADGADYLAWQWADERDVPCGSYAADWDDLDHPDAVIRHRKGKPYNANAGAIRNQRMIDKGKPDGVEAFPGGPGTDDMVHRATAAGMPVWQPIKDTTNVRGQRRQDHRDRATRQADHR